MLKICCNCGKEYNVPKSREQRSKFCSDKCFRESKNTQVLYNCDYCHQPFMVRKAKVDKRTDGTSKYLCCSADCARNIQKPKWDDVVQIFKDRRYILKSSEYIDNKSKLEYICPKHRDKGSQFIIYNNIKNGYGCRYCGIETTADSRRLTFEDVRKIFANNDMELLDGQIYRNTSELMAYTCIRHKERGVQYMTTSNAYRNHCPHCNKSKGEDKISKYFIQNNIDFIQQHKFADLVGLGGRQLSYDFYLPHTNMLIEYQGEFHDGNVTGMQTQKDLEIQQEHDRRKREYAKNHNIRLLEIWYYDLANIEDILNNILINT